MDGRLLHFEYRGLYDGVSLLRDRETSTFWHHITGKAMWGPLAGARLVPTSNALQMDVGAALQAYPDLAVALSDRPVSGQPSRWSPWLAQVPVLGERFLRTMGQQDARRPAMDVGLGVWTEREARFYPMERIVDADNAIVDVLDGRSVVIAYPLNARAPTALYVETRNAAWQGDALRFDDGSQFENGRLVDNEGRERLVQRPMQLFTRWYGYALTFPATGVYGQR